LPLFLVLVAAPARAMIPRISSSAHDHQLFTVDLDFRAAVFAEQKRDRLFSRQAPAACRLPLYLPSPTATTSPSCGFSLAVSGMMMPPEPARLVIAAR